MDQESDEDEEFGADEGLKMFQSIDWLKRFHPTEVSDLVVHPKKLEELRNWFKISCAKVRNKILLLEGPTGSAKTTALKLIAKESGFQVCEWTNSTDLEIDLFYEGSENFQREFVSYENQVSKFTDFLLQSSRFPSVFAKGERLLIVKDFPNTFLRKTEEFWSILRKYEEDGLSPLVFVLTETNSKSLNIAFNLFPEKIRIEMKIDSISFNRVSTTMMKRGIKRIVQMVESNNNYKQFFKRPTEDIIDGLIEQSQGDIRNTVLNLNFASQQSSFKLSVTKAVKSKKTGKKSKLSEKSTSDGGLGKNEILPLMHGLGRVFRPKLELNSSSKKIELTHKPETIAESFQSQPSNFISMIHSNYIKNFTDIHSISSATEIFSISNCFEAEYRDSRLNHLNLNLVVRAAMVLNKQPAAGMPSISAYANKKWKNSEEKNKEKFNKASASLNNGNMIGRNDFFCDYNNFMNMYK